MANKLSTMGYFIKRLRDSGYVVDRLFGNYAYHDPRSWSVVIDPKCASVFCTCYQNSPEPGEAFFEIYDGGLYIPGRHKIQTSSIEVFVSELVKFDINNKSRSYTNKTNTRV